MFPDINISLNYIKMSHLVLVSRYEFLQWMRSCFELRQTWMFVHLQTASSCPQLYCQGDSVPERKKI